MSTATPDKIAPEELDDLAEAAAIAVARHRGRCSAAGLAEAAARLAPWLAPWQIRRVVREPVFRCGAEGWEPSGERWLHQEPARQRLAELLAPAAAPADQLARLEAAAAAAAAERGGRRNA